MGLKKFYGDDLSCRSTHKGLMWNLDSPVAIHVDYLVRIIYNPLIIDILQYRTLLSTCIVRAPAQCLISRLGVISPQAREAARWREVEGEEKGQLDGKPAWARIGEGWKMPYNVLICIPTNLVCISLFHIFTQFL